MKVIGAVGRIGSGKDTILGIIAKKEHCKLVSFGDMTRELAKKEGLEPTRENLIRVQREYRAKYGGDYFARRAVKEIKAERTRVVCVDGVRRKVEASMLKRKYGKDFVLIYVKVPANIRYRRLAKRGRVGDPRTYREFVEQDRSEERAFYISETIKLADYTISNEGSVRELGAKVEHLLERILKNNSGPNN